MGIPLISNYSHNYTWIVCRNSVGRIVCIVTSKRFITILWHSSTSTTVAIASHIRHTPFQLHFINCTEPHLQWNQHRCLGCHSKSYTFFSFFCYSFSHANVIRITEKCDSKIAFYLYHFFFHIQVNKEERKLPWMVSRWMKQL